MPISMPKYMLAGAASWTAPCRRPHLRLQRQCVVEQPPHALLVLLHNWGTHTCRGKCAALTGVQRGPTEFALTPSEPPPTPP